MPITQVGAMTISPQQDFFTLPTTIARPTGVIQGDLVIVLFSHQGQGGEPTMVDGFTRLILTTAYASLFRSAVFYKLMSATEFSTWNISHTADYRGAVAVAFRGASLISPVEASASNDVATGSGTAPFPGVTSTRSGVQLALTTGKSAGATALGYPAGYTGAGATTQATMAYTAAAAAFTVRAIGTHPAGSFSNAGTEVFGASLFLADANAVPNAPTLTYPTGNVTIDRNVLLRFSWNFSDPDPGDTQSKYDIEYRIVGAGSWTTLTGVTAYSFHDSGAGTFAAGAWEWRLRTHDSLGAVGPYSASAFFTAGNVPAGPTVTAPTNGSTVSAASTTLVWSSPTQEAYQVRKVADAAGVADTATVYFDTGVVEQASVRSHQLTFPVNSRNEHLQVRVRTSGLWSTWASTRVLVSFTPPGAPTLTVTPVSSTGSINVAIAQTPANLLSAEASSFEGGTAGGWNNAVNSAIRAFSGTKSITVTNGASAIAVNTDTVAYVLVGTVAAGVRRTYSVYVFSTATCTLGVWRSTDGGDVNGASNGALGPATAVAANTWTRLTLTYTTVAVQNDYLRIYAQSLAANQVFHVDAAQVVVGSVAPAYTEAGAGPPTAVNADLWRREGSTGNGIRVAAGLLPAATYIDRTVASGQVYEYRAVSFAANGASATSAWTL